MMDGFLRSNSGLDPGMKLELSTAASSSQPAPALPFNHQSEDPHLGLRQREVFIAVALPPPAPRKRGILQGMDQGRIRARENAGSRSKGVGINSLRRLASNRGVPELEVSSA